MIVGVDETVEYILEADRDSESPTVFLIKTIDAQRFMQISSVAQTIAGGKGRDNGSTKVGAVFDICLQVGLAGWRNFKDKDGNEIPFDGARGLNRLLPIWRIELAKAVSNHNGLSQEERKN